MGARCCACGKMAYDRPTCSTGEGQKQKGARLLFADEASMRSDYHAGTTWAPRGKTPIVKVMGQRHTVINMVSAVGLTGEFEFMLIEGRGNSNVGIRKTCHSCSGW